MHSENVMGAETGQAKIARRDGGVWRPTNTGIDVFKVLPSFEQAVPGAQTSGPHPSQLAPAPLPRSARASLVSVDETSPPHMLTQCLVLSFHKTLMVLNSVFLRSLSYPH